MPIKFRCPNCRQFLGISRSKAGSVTDCPNCGRSLRVPNLDGKVAPIPKPALNLGDAVLANALGALADVGEDTPTTKSPAAVSPPAVSAPASVTVSVAPAPPPVVVEVHAPAPLPRDSVKKSAAVRAPDVQSPSSAAVLESLAAMKPATAAPLPPVRPRRETPAWLRTLRFAVVLLGIGGGLGAAAVYYAGDRSGARGGEEPTAATAGKGTTSESLGPDLSALTGMSFTPALTGRVTYTSDVGAGRPDADARIIALPEQRKTSVPLPVAAFRAGATDADWLLARAALRAVGGDCTRADAEGHYELSLPAAGSYRVLIISRHQEDRDPAPLDASVNSLMAQVFDKPAQLVGKVKCYTTTLKFDGATASPRDHTFDRR